MVFSPPEWVPKLPFDPPDSIPISDFMLNERHGRYPLAKSKPPFTCGISGTEYTALQVRDRVDFLARSLAKELRWHPNQGTGWDKVVGVFSVNTVSSRK
jgi:ribosome assembly protein SQT1